MSIEKTALYTVFQSEWDEVLGDPRVPWEIPLDNNGEVEKGQDGSTPFYRQLKYVAVDDDVPLTHGAEALMIRAEAALRSGDLDGMTARLNEARDHYGMDPLTVPASVADAWAVMRFERGATTWLEGRRLWDLARWKAEGGSVADPFAQDRETCFPIGDAEKRANPNL